MTVILTHCSSIWILNIGALAAAGGHDEVLGRREPARAAGGERVRHGGAAGGRHTLPPRDGLRRAGGQGTPLIKYAQ